MKLFEASLPILAIAWSDLYGIAENGVDLVFRNDTSFFAKYRENIEKVGNCQNSVPVQDSSGNMVTVPPILWPTQGASPNVVDYEKCVYIFSNFNMMWSDAEKVCEDKISSSCTPNCKGNLVGIHTDFQDQAIFDAFKSDEGTGKPAWIGLRQYCAFCPLEWADHGPFDFRNWLQGEPNNEDGDEDCVETNFFSEGWNDNTCSAKRQFVCQIYTSATNQHPKPEMDKTWPAIGGCKDGWWKYGKACFKIIGGRGNSDAQKEEPAMNWDDSKTQCSNEWAGASLAQFPNIYYQYFANSLGLGLQ